VPEWFFAETAVLAKMSSVRIKLICRQILLKLSGKGVNYEKLQKLTTSKRQSFSRSDVKAIIAGLEFILENAAKHNVEAEVLQEELMQLGLPQVRKIVPKKIPQILPSPSETRLSTPPPSIQTPNRTHARRCERAMRRKRRRYARTVSGGVCGWGKW
jgi:hypothetical protein